jgi:hypothetical protein
MMIHGGTERGIDDMNLLDTQTDGNMTMTNIMTDRITADILLTRRIGRTPRTIITIHLNRETEHPPPKHHPPATPAPPVPNRKRFNSLQGQSLPQPTQRKSPKK